MKHDISELAATPCEDARRLDGAVCFSNSSRTYYAAPSIFIMTAGVEGALCAASDSNEQFHQKDGGAWNF